MATPTALPTSFVAGQILTAGDQNLLRGAFRVLQVVSGVLTSAVTTSSATLATTGLTATITPQYTTSKILVLANISSCKTAATITGIELAFFRGASNVQTIEKNLGYNTSSTTNIINASGMLFDSPATIAATTYTLYFARSTGTGVVEVNNGSNTTSTITLLEISA